MIAPGGTPIAAASAGFAEFKASNSGGNAIWLTTVGGDKFYYAHLDSWEGSSRDVSAGEIIGYVGSSGNARGNHLHFEAQPNGTPTNPFPAVTTACNTEVASVPDIAPTSVLLQPR
jgi:murein DD-endopeptidase MepM/ murein hydrolase activator NlpD